MNSHATMAPTPVARDRNEESARTVVPRDRPPSRAEWWSVCEADPNASFFATPDWADILTTSFRRFHARPLVFDGDAPAACLIPAIEVRRGGRHLSSLHAMPFGTYGGILRRDPIDARARDAAIEFFLTHDGPSLQRTLYPNPLGDPLPATVTTHSGYVHAIDLSRGWQHWWDHLDQSTRHEVRNPERRGVEVHSDMNAETFETFSRNYAREARARRGAFDVSDRFMASVWEARSPRIELWTAYKDSHMIAGVLVFRFRAHMTPFLSFVHSDYRALSPSRLLYGRMIARACEFGVTGFNFLGSGGNPGVEHFKHSMGARRVDFGYVNAAGALHSFIHHGVVSWARTGAREMRRRLP
jgi:CelD/BcsL family acetyltransferase involved in cellulose biosynthesis